MLQITVGQMFRNTAARFPQNPCMETPEGTRSYAETDALTDRLARKLLLLGLRKGSRAGIWCKDTPEFLCLYLAMEKIGCVPVLLNTALTGAEMAVLLKKVDAGPLFFDEGFKGVSFRKELESLSVPDTHFIPDFFRSLPELTANDRRALNAACAAVQPEDPDVIIFTSGTSGTAKGVLSTHLARVNVARIQAETVDMTEADKCCVAIPLYHCFGLTGIALAALYAGACLYFPPERRTARLLEAVSTYRCTVFSAVPTLFSALLARSDLSDYDFSSLRTGYIGGAVYTPEFFRRTEEAFGFRLAPSLGQTEATAGLTFLSPNADDTLRSTTVGRFPETLEGQIRDISTGKALPKGESGEICLRGWSVMLGYVNDPEQTAAALEPDGWLHTGDLGWLDAQDCLHISGRLKELIIRGGENISPAEIEAAIGMDPRVREVKAVAVPDPHYGEEICACVVLREGVQAPDPAELRTLAGHQLAAYKVPRYILYLSELPKTGSGKLALAALKKQAAEALHL